MAGEHASALSTSLSNDPAMSRAFFLLASGDEKRPNDGNPGLPDLATLCRQAAKTSEVPRMTPPGTNLPPLPRAPLLDWSSFSPAKVSAELHSIDNIRHTQMTTSGRAAIYQALLQLRLAPASVVLVPTYHCPTMIAPVILAQLEVAYFGISADGLPKLDSIDPATAAKAKAMLVPHYFGLAKSLAQVRQWCDEHQIALIEDCAHCYFGNAGERPVGTWGDFSTASLSKFFPVPEGGVLASASRTIEALDLAPQGFKAQLKAWVDVFESAVSCGRFAGINWALAGLLRVKNSLAHGRQGTSNGQASAPEDIMLTCDMERIARAPLSPALLLKKVLPRGRIIARRRQNFALYARHFAGVSGAHALYRGSVDNLAPYVFPLWVEDADRVYQAMRAQGLPVFRWDRSWPGTPRMPDDAGPSWSRHVLQLLCHQDLSPADITRTALATLHLLANSQSTTAPRA